MSPRWFIIAAILGALLIGFLVWAYQDQANDEAARCDGLEAQWTGLQDRLDEITATGEVDGSTVIVSETLAVEAAALRDRQIVVEYDLWLDECGDRWSDPTTTNGWRPS